MPVDRLAVDLAVAMNSAQAEMDAIEDARKGNKKKARKPGTKAEYRDNVKSLEKLYEMQMKP